MLKTFEKYIQQALPYGFILDRIGFKYITTRTSFRKIGEVNGQLCMYKVNDETKRWEPEIYSEDIYFLIFYGIAHDELEKLGFETAAEYNNFLDRFERYKALLLIADYMEGKNF